MDQNIRLAKIAKNSANVSQLPIDHEFLLKCYQSNNCDLVASHNAETEWWTCKPVLHVFMFFSIGLLCDG
jgi:hypothetical protein